MVFNVRCFKCGEHQVRLVLGGRAIIHARCHGCDSNLLAEVMKFEKQVYAEMAARADEESAPQVTSTLSPPDTLEEESWTASSP